MIKREDLMGKTQEEFQNLLEVDIQAYKVEVMEIADEAEVLNREQEIMDLMRENEEYMKTVNYTLPENCTFDGQVYSKKTIGEFIVDFVNSMEVTWSYSLGMYDMVKIWRNKNIREVQYAVYDSTLRILDQCKFKGFESWKKILAINEFMKSCHEEYVRDTSYIIYLSQLHNALLDALKKFNPEVESTDMEQLA